MAHEDDETAVAETVPGVVRAGNAPDLRALPTEAPPPLDHIAHRGATVPMPGRWAVR